MVYNISNVIFDIIDQVESNKFVAIVSDRTSNITAVRRIIMQKHPNIININCIAYCVNLINYNIIKISHIKYLMKCYNILTKFFKNSHIEGVLLKDTISLKGIEEGNLKTYIEIQ